ncbi:hypothetical protein THRCLA_04574, partial [Thraustotheca clavata]
MHKLPSDILGWVYLVCSMSLSAYALFLFAPFTENGLFWPGFYSYNTLHVVGAIINEQLLFNSSFMDIDLFNPALSVWQLSHAGVSLAYPRLLLYQELTTLSDAINGLRNLEPSYVSFMITPYCWVDMQQRWVLAHTSIRLQRCQQRDFDNAAVYLESVLRNIDMDAWLAVSGGSFLTKIAIAVQTTQVGREWVDGILKNSLISIEEEIEYWKQYHLQRFTLQYANRVQIGIVENIAIINALGFSYNLPIKQISASNRGPSWTSAYMYQGLYNDFNAVPPNQSLVFNSDTFIGLLAPHALEAYDVGYPLNAINQLIHDHIGPLDSIDLRWIAVPRDMILAVTQFKELVMTQLQSNTLFYTAFAKINPVVLLNIPYIWQDPNLRFLSGNPMCSDGDPMPYVQSAFGFDDACGTQIPAVLPVTSFNSLFALHMVRGDTRDICSQLPSQRQLCESTVKLLLSAYTLLFTNTSISIPDIVSLKLGKVQFVLNGSDYSLQTIKLLGERFDFFGWVNIYDWTTNQREAISFEGDYQTLNLLSYAYTPTDLPTIGIKTNTNVGMYLWYGSAVVTVILTTVAILSTLLWIIYRPKLGTTRWFLFNRIASTSWLNHAIISIRSLTAVICLSTALVEPEMSRPSLTRLTYQSRSYFNSAVLSGEATWITFLIHEILHPVTQRHTRLAAYLSQSIAWATILLIDQTYPVKLLSKLERGCFSENMDWELYCESAILNVGSLDRTILIITIQFASVAAGLFIKLTSTRYKKRRGVRPIFKEIRQQSLLFQASVNAFIAQTDEEFSDDINRPTAAMAGLFLLRRYDHTCLFDINRWTYLPQQMVKGGLTFVGSHFSVCAPTMHDITQTSAPIISPNQNLIPHREFKWSDFNPLWLVTGIVYILGTITSNIAYFTVVSDNLANDYGWAGYNSTGMQAFLANIYNKHLLLVSSTHDHTPLPLDENTIADWTQLYNDSTASIVWSEGSARRQLYGQTNQLSQVMTDLRNMNPCNLPWVSTQYCWLDFNRTWTMATTTTRQSRCDHHMYNNGAVYLESSLRNMNDWVAFESCWGHSFDVGFVQHIQSSLDGQIWLRDVRTNTNSIEEEVAFWHRHQITTYVLQWQNYK